MLVRETNPSYIPKTPIMIEIVNIRHVKPHRHNDAIEFIYCMSGSVKMTIAHQKINIYENELVTVDHDDIHYMTADTDNIVLIIHIDLKNIRHQWEDIQYIFFSCATGLARPDQKRAMEEIYDIMMALAYTYMTQRESAVQVYKNMSDRLIDILLEKFCWFSVEGLTSEENEKYRSRLNNIGAYIQKNYKEKITISQLAKHEFIDENYLSQFIKRTSFLSFTFMINYIRAYEAEKLLLFSDRSIQEISDACGFSSTKYFHKYFKIIWETTPLQHRLHYRSIAHLPQDVQNCTDDDTLKFIEKRIIDIYMKKVL